MKTQNIKLPLFFWLLMGCLSLQAQNTNQIDSLKNLLKTTNVGSDKTNLYGQISWAYINNSQLEPATNYADSIRLLGENIKDEKEIAYAQFYYGVIARHQGQNSRALEHLNTFINYNALVGDSAKVAHGLFQVGSINARIGNYEPSLKALYRALKIHESREEQSSINFALNSIGVVLRAAKRYDDALEVYQKVLNTDSLNAMVLLNVGNIFLVKNELNKAETNYRRALKIDESRGDIVGMAYDLENLGNLYNVMNRHDEALVYHTRAMKIREGLPDNVDEGVSLRQIGVTHRKLKNYAVSIIQIKCLH